jgi:DNA polymerase
MDVRVAYQAPCIAHNVHVFFNTQYAIRNTQSSFGGSMAKSAEVLKEIASQVSTCEKCALHFSRKKAVPGEGPANAQIMFIGEGPGFYENEQGKPFVGAAGQFLSELLGKINLKREQVYITNVVKCRPPGNRDPLPDELANCSDYLDRQIEALNPRVIVTLGRFSMARFLPMVKISDVHGQASWVRGRLIVAMYHPSAALHQPSLKPILEKDFNKLPEYILQANQVAKTTKPAESAHKVEQPTEPPKDEPTQLSLF